MSSNGGGLASSHPGVSFTGTADADPETSEAVGVLGINCSFSSGLASTLP